MGLGLALLFQKPIQTIPSITINRGLPLGVIGRNEGGMRLQTYQNIREKSNQIVGRNAPYIEGKEFH